jgi:hypothetical protein
VAVVKINLIKKNFYRFLGNNNVTKESLIAEVVARCANNVGDRDIAVIQDSSSFGLSHRSGKIQDGTGLGLVGNKNGLGFMTHTSLVRDVNNETMLGFCDVQLWHRTQDKSNNVGYRSEAYRYNREDQQSIPATKIIMGIMDNRKVRRMER